MSTKFFIFILGLFSCFNIYAQNYRSIKSDAEYYFFCTSCEIGDINAISIDSTLAIGNDTILYNFKSMRNPVYNETCGNLYGASWLGKKIILKANGFNLFFNKYNDTIKINTLANINTSWVLYKYPDNKYIEATVNEIDTTTFLGITDSIKVISFLVKDLNGDIVTNNLNSKTIILSKYHGIIKTPDFYEFPYDSVPDITSTSQQYIQDYKPDYCLTGKTNPILGIVNLKAKDIYNFNIGDEFHTEQMYVFVGPGTKYITNLISTIIGKSESLNQDTLTYIIKRCGKKDSWVSSHSFTYYNDTITTTYIWSQNQYKQLDVVPNKTQFYFEYDYYDLKIDFSYNNRRIKWNPPVMAFTNWPDSCYYMGTTTPNQTVYYYIDGCGEYYYGNYDNVFGEYDHLSLVYFKKGNETWGTPYDCNALLNINPNEIIQPVVSLYPNPIESNSCFEINNINEVIQIFTLYNSTGIKIKSEKGICSNKVYINKEILTKGIYFYNIETLSGKNYSGKLLVR